MNKPTAARAWLVWSLLALQMLIAAVGVFAWRATATPAPAPSWEVGVATPAALPATLEGGLAVAAERAAAWRSGARLLSATMQVDWPWDPPPPTVRSVPGTGWLTYVFVAPWEPTGRREEAASLTVLVERLSGAVVAQDALGWEEAPVPDPAATPPAVSSTAAVLVAEAVGGTAFRGACPHYRHLTRAALVAERDRPPVWAVTYEDAREPTRHGLRVRVDAATGEVMEIGGEAVGCEEEAFR